MSTLEEEFVLEDLEIECPFTWGMDHLVQYFEEDYNDLRIDESDQPLIGFMNDIMDVFVNVKQEKFLSAKTSLENAIGIYDHMICPEQQKLNAISMGVLQHILSASSYYFYKKTSSDLKFIKDRLNEVSDIEKVRKDCRLNLDINGDFEVTLNGCKAIAWSVFKDHGCKKAIFYAQQVIPNMNFNKWPLWQFVLGINLRERRFQKYGYCRINYYQYSYEKIPKPEEQYHLRMAFELEPSSGLYTIYAADMYFESRVCNSHLKVHEIYKKLYTPSQMNGDISHLRHAIAFIKNYNGLSITRKKNHLNSLKKLANKPKIKMLVPYYWGIYYFYEEQNFKKALEDFKEAARLGNAMAELKYVEVRIKMGIPYNYVTHFEHILKKYPDDKSVVRLAALHLAMENYNYRNELMIALNYFLTAIKINPKSKHLKNYEYLYEEEWERVNIYNYLRDDVQDQLDKISLKDQNDLQRIISDLENLYAQYKGNTDKSKKLFNRINL